MGKLLVNSNKVVREMGEERVEALIDQVAHAENFLINEIVRDEANFQTTKITNILPKLTAFTCLSILRELKAIKKIMVGQKSECCDLDLKKITESKVEETEEQEKETTEEDFSIDDFNVDSLEDMTKKELVEFIKVNKDVSKIKNPTFAKVSELKKEVKDIIEKQQLSKVEEKDS